MIPLSDLLACAKRELAMRRNVYPKWTASGRMKPEAAQHELACMEGIVNRIEMLLMLEQSSEEMPPHRRD